MGLTVESMMASLASSGGGNNQTPYTCKDDAHAAEALLESGPYNLIAGAQLARAGLFEKCHEQLPPALHEYAKHIQYTATLPWEAAFFPCPLKEQETATALKALEGCAAAAIADVRFGRPQDGRTIDVNVDQAARFLMSAYLVTVNGKAKVTHPEEVKKEVPQTDLNQAQSVLYRRLAAGLYETKTRGEYYHIHGSLEASTTLRMIGLPAFDDSLTDYRKCIEKIEGTVKRFTVAELESLNIQNRQAGFPVLKWDEFSASPHGKGILEKPPFTVDELETSTPPVPFDDIPPAASPSQQPQWASATPSTAASGHGSHQPLPPQTLQGIRVLELCRVIAGPTIGRSLAAHGASVLKITSPSLPDVPFFQLDVNVGKHAASLDLRASARDRATFEDLLRTADVLIDGYRPGALEALGYGPVRLASLARERGKGYVYVAEDCFGQVVVAEEEECDDGEGSDGSDGRRKKSDWSGRRGWQQVADCATGVAWAQGRFMGLAEPVVPPFPMSDYGTGALGCVAAMVGIWRRATQGGSWQCRTSLCQYDAFVMSLGLLPPEVQRRLRGAMFAAGDGGSHRSPSTTAGFGQLRHHDSVDEVGRRALEAMGRAWPALFGAEQEQQSDRGVMCSAWSPGFGVDGAGAEVRWPREAVRVTGLSVGHVRPPRPNGSDPPSWEELEADLNHRLLSG